MINKTNKHNEIKYQIFIKAMEKNEAMNKKIEKSHDGIVNWAKNQSW